MVQTVLAFAVFVAFADGREVTWVGKVLLNCLENSSSQYFRSRHWYHKDYLFFGSNGRLFCTGWCYVKGNSYKKVVSIRFHADNPSLLPHLARSGLSQSLLGSHQHSRWRFRLANNVWTGHRLDSAWRCTESWGYVELNSKAIINKYASAVWNDELICVEMLLISITASVVFRPSVCDLFLDVDEWEKRSLLNALNGYGECWGIVKVNHKYFQAPKTHLRLPTPTIDSHSRFSKSQFTSSRNPT